MEIIKSIRKLKNNQYTLTTESGKRISVSEDTLVRYRLLKGEEITSEALETIEKEAELDIGYQQALSYLNYQLRSEKEIKDHLKKKEISSEGIRYVINKLKEINLLDDLVFAESYVRTVMKTQDKGPQQIKQSLIKKGISEEHIEKSLEQFFFDDQEEAATKLAIKALRKYQAKSHKEQLQKVRQHLFTKGYSSDVINLVMSNLEVEKDEDDEWDTLVAQGDKLWRKHARLDRSKRNQKIKQSLFQKGFDFDVINRYIEEKEMADDNE
ncbi:recombination regulator RecX [Vagococcus sp. DIV0080]|uniref:Regulatory protein RecX n=1 Tax=Candidatus Vagococcus giribetii TaxID=2230876 RepID=A0ABS3HUA9_9ENTE|nr:recombination regulator RecX [Vagococcus sp. DIV0080]MBO0477338.1 recombination regulator RecX [Vagococcus sp. DIV0080]